MSASQIRRSFCGLNIAFALCACFAAVSSQADQLLTNGNFETGSFTGWLLANQANPTDIIGADHFYISTPGSLTP
ncbi:MAG: hypothetical protein JWN14_1865, partial [Chthonomonadales bacterium]|nr:hypothetical protein [Chthonomonadales bacterium]